MVTFLRGHLSLAANFSRPLEPKYSGIKPVKGPPVLSSQGPDPFRLLTAAVRGTVSRFTVHAYVNNRYTAVNALYVIAHLKKHSVTSLSILCLKNSGGRVKGEIEG